MAEGETRSVLADVLRSHLAEFATGNAFVSFMSNYFVDGIVSRLTHISVMFRINHVLHIQHVTDGTQAIVNIICHFIPT